MNSSQPCLFPPLDHKGAVSLQRELVGQEEPPRTKPGQKSQVGVLVSEGRKNGGKSFGLCEDCWKISEEEERLKQVYKDIYKYK